MSGQEVNKIVNDWPTGAKYVPEHAQKFLAANDVWRGCRGDWDLCRPGYPGPQRERAIHCGLDRLFWQGYRDRRGTLGQPVTARHL
jgi:hypothetical protein